MVTVNFTIGHVRDLHRYTAGQKIVSPMGRTYEVIDAWTADDDKGRSRDWVIVNCNSLWERTMIAHDFTWTLNADEREAERNASPFGDYLPIFPTIYASPSNPVTEDRIERTVERLTDCADRALMDGKATQEQYDRWNVALNNWTREYYSAL